MQNITRIILIICLLMFLNALQANEVKTVKLAVENSWPPYADKSGNGISKEIVQKAYNAVGINVNFVVVPYARALKMAEHGIVDGAFNVTKQESTIAKFNFHNTPLLKATASFYYPKNSTLDFLDIQDVPPHTSIALIIDYEYGEQYEALKHKYNEVRVSTQHQIIELLKTGRIDMAIMFDEVAKFTLAELDLPMNTVRKGHINHVSDIYVAFTQKRDVSEKISLLDTGLQKTSQQEQ